MKKVLSLLLLSLSLGLVVACQKQAAPTTNKSQEATTTTASTATKAERVKSGTHTNNTITFKEGTLETPQATVKITKTQVGHDTDENRDGLIIWYTITNKTKTEHFEPEDIIKNLTFQQSNPTLVIDDLDAKDILYPEDSQPDAGKAEAFENTVADLADRQLQAGQTAETVTTITLHNTNDPVKVYAPQGKNSEIYRIDLK